MRRWDKALLYALEEADAAIEFKMRYQLAHRRLRDVEHLGPPTDGASLDHRAESFDLAQIDVPAHFIAPQNGRERS